MIGSDVVGSFDNVGKIMHGFDPVLDALPEDVAKAIAHDNFLTLLPDSKDINTIKE